MTQHRKYGLWLALLATAVMMAGCGIKPKHLAPPDGNKDFPRNYPQTGQQ